LVALSKETKEKMRLSALKMTEEHKKKLSVSRTGKKHPEEVKEKIKTSIQKCLEEKRMKVWHGKTFRKLSPKT